MDTTFKFRANRDKWQVDIPEIEFRDEKPAIIGYHIQDWKIVSLGENDIEARQSYLSSRNDVENIDFVHPFDITEFDSEMAMMVLESYLGKVKKKRLENWQSMFGSFDKWILQLQIENYEDIPQIKRSRFEFMLRHITTISFQSILINGKTVQVSLKK
jgi:hypothetical protein